MSGMNPVTLHSKVSRREDLETREVENSTVMAKLSNGDYYGVESIGRRIWILLERPSTVAEVCATLLREYEVDAETCEREVLEFINDLTREGLLKAD